MGVPKSFKDIDARNQAILDRIVNTDYPTHCRFKDLSGNDYGYLHVDKYYGKDGRGHLYYWCTCKCGNRILVRATHLQSGVSKSCGCLMSEETSKRCHINKYGTKHNLHGTRLYYSWSNMIQRCTNPNNRYYAEYGARGIKVCEEWKNASNFINWALSNGYNDTLTIDRIDFNGDYCPENCRWVGLKVQENNKSVNNYVQYDRWVFPVTIWAEITGIKRATLYYRINESKWSIAESLFTPPNGDRSKIPITFKIPQEYEIYNKYDEWVKKGKILPVEETIYKGCI